MLIILLFFKKKNDSFNNFFFFNGMYSKVFYCYVPCSNILWVVHNHNNLMFEVGVRNSHPPQLKQGCGILEYIS